MRSLSVAGDYQILGRCNDIDGVQVFAARRISDLEAERLYMLHHFPICSASAEQEVRGLVHVTRTFDDPMLVVPRDVVRTDEGLFIVTDFVAGETLEYIIRSNRAAIFKVLAVAIARDLARAIFHARERTGRATFGDASCGQLVISYETGDLKLITIGASIIRGRAPTPATKAVGLVLWEMLSGKKAQGDPNPPKAGADLDRIVMNAIAHAPVDDLALFADQLASYVRTRTMGLDREAELQKLIRQHFSHKATAMRALVQRWRSQTGSMPAIPRRTSVPPPPPRRTSVPPPPPPRRTSSIRPTSIRPREERRPEAAFAEALEDIIILPPEELAPTDDISASGLRPPRRGWPKLRLAFLLMLFALSLASAALVVLNGDLEPLLASWKQTAVMVRAAL